MIVGARQEPLAALCLALADAERREAAERERHTRAAGGYRQYAAHTVKLLIAERKALLDNIGREAVLLAKARSAPRRNRRGLRRARCRAWGRQHADLTEAGGVDVRARPRSPPSSAGRARGAEGAAIRIPVHRNEKITKLDRALERLDVRVGGAVSDLELAEELEWAIDEVRQFRGIPREAEYPASLDDWDNLLPEPPEVDVFGQAETERIVTDALADLPERQADVIRMRFGIGRASDMTLEEIGQIYGVTRERIRQIEAKGLDRLSHPGRKRRLQELLGM